MYRVSVLSKSSLRVNGRESGELSRASFVLLQSHWCFFFLFSKWDFRSVVGVQRFFFGLRVSGCRPPLSVSESYVVTGEV
jgi:hypothetical protein